MKAVCSFCGHRNRAQATVCSRCCGSLADARREHFRIPWGSWAPAIPVALLLWAQHQHGERVLAAMRVEAANETKKGIAGRAFAARELQEKFESEQAKLDAAHRAMLADSRLISGATAAERHAEEWRRRQDHAPALAETVLEKTLLEVERLGKDSSLTAEAALQKVAELVTPAGSRIEVKPGEKGFVVRVAFRLGAVNPNEAGTWTAHTSSSELRKEIEEITARVLKDIYESCGARGVQRVSVSCNRAIITGPDSKERLTMRSLYRGVMEADKAATVANWRTLSASRIAALMTVEHDIVGSIMIRKGSTSGLSIDPDEPLEF